ncbi:hypothetical protein HL658_27975 [Azospirillum sp. RWY-5-1]|uniref:Uncharacterized protein n=1 Tax=Azospirillum oleiclasticum TaxID=2735135 RepID=A0ABX2TKM6_9PROT|nr:hypothetical protein [Azospirillum oleiclasticum]NYZ16398.1 hypothetical protein [Azospirillum oleiclasticum]NYZ23886.1 hypothetical protein [Azospirillum oleiclasticum]
MDATETTTANDAAPPAARGPTGPRRLGAAVVAVALGGALVWLGAPRLIAALESLDARTVIWDARAGHPPPPDRLAAAAADLDAAQRWAADGEAMGDRGFLLVQQARATPPGPERGALLDRAAQATEAGLAAAPAQPSAWARLAWLHVARGDRAAAIPALRLSLLTGPVAPALMASRLELGLELLSLMDPDTRGLLRRQVRLLWVVSPETVAAMSQKPDTGGFVRDALNDLSEEDMAAFLRVHGPKS